MKVAINIVTWNSHKYIVDCLRSVYNQSYKDFFVLVVDNASTDGTLELVQKDFPGIQILRNFKNVGFSRAHNQGIELAKKSGAEYVLVMNPDIILEPNFLEEIVKAAELNPKAGSVGGKLLRVDSSTFVRPRRTTADRPQPLLKKGKVIDSVGLKIFRSRKTVDRGAGEMDSGQYDTQEEVFGISGALALYRMEALEDVKIDSCDLCNLCKLVCPDYFDNDFFAYKEDVDLAWRLQLAGWKAIYLPTAVAYHHRLAGGRKRSWWQEIKDHYQRSKVINYLTYKNQWLLLTKNDYRENFFRDFAFILWDEIRRFGYTLLFEPRNLKAIFKYLSQRPRARQKRKIIMSRARVGAGEMRKWFR